MEHRMLIVDDEELLARLMQDYFETQGYTVDRATTLDSALSLLASHDHSVVLADVRLSGPESEEGIEITRCVRASHPWTVILLFTGQPTPEIEAVAGKEGANAVLRKPKPLAELAQLISAMLSSPQVVRAQLKHRMDVHEQVQPRGERPQVGIVDERRRVLSEREMKISILVAQGARNREIAAAIGSTEQSVKNDLVRIYNKLNVWNRVELARYMMQHQPESGFADASTAATAGQTSR